MYHGSFKLGNQCQCEVRSFEVCQAVDFCRVNKRRKIENVRVTFLHTFHKVHTVDIEKEKMVQPISSPEIHTFVFCFILNFFVSSLFFANGKFIKWPYLIICEQSGYLVRARARGRGGGSMTRLQNVFE